MKQEELIKRIEELDRRVRDLESRPVYVPMPYPAPQPYGPWWGGKITIGDHTGCAPLTTNHESWATDGVRAWRVA